MNDHSGGLYPEIWAVIASGAGAVTSLSFQQWEGMSPTKIVLSLLVAAGFGFFVSPLVLLKIKDPQIGGAVIFLMAAGSNVLIPRCVKGVSGLLDRVFGTTPEANP